MVIGRDGKSDWANATGAAAIKPAATQAKVQATTIAFFIGFPPFGVSGRHGLRANVDHGGAAHVADMRAGLKGRSPVHGAAVVPDHEVVAPPFVRVDETGRGREFE